MGTHTYTTTDGITHTFIGEFTKLDDEIAAKEAAAKAAIQNKKNSFNLLTDKEKIKILAEKLGLQ